VPGPTTPIDRADDLMDYLASGGETAFPNWIGSVDNVEPEFLTG
jgi:hypothetical protein